MKRLFCCRVFLLLLFLTASFSVFSETLNPEIIKQKIYEVYVKKNDSAFAFSSVEKIIKESEKINYPSGVAAALQLKGYLYLSYGHFDMAKQYIFDAYELNKGLGNDTVLAQNLRIISMYYERKEEYEIALEYIFQSLNLRKKINDPKGIAECNASIGIIFHYTNQIQKAILYYKKSLSYYLLEKNEKSIADLQSNIGAAFNSLGNLDSAIYYLQSVAQIKIKLKDYIGLGQTYHNLGISYSLEGQYQRAFEYFNLAIKNTGGGENNDNNGTSYQLAGGVLIKLKRYDEAKKYLAISESILKKNNLTDELAENHLKFSELYEKIGDFKKSIYYNSLKNKLVDSLAQVKTKLSFDEIEAKYKAVEKSHEVELLKAQNKILEHETKYYSALAIGSLILMIVITILGFYLNILRRTRNKLIHQNQIIESQNKAAVYQNNNLENLIAENQTIMGVLAHDLRSPFGKIAGLTHLLRDEQDEKERIVFTDYIQNICKEALQIIQDTIHISEIYNEKANNLSAKTELFKPSAVLSNTVNSFKAIAQEKGIILELTDASDNVTIENSQEYLSRILDNLISNAIKFSPANAKVLLYSNVQQNHIVIGIKDQGPGLSEKDKEKLFKRFQKLSAKPTANESSTGLGLFIVKQLVELMDGTITVNSVQGQGAEFIVTLPLQKQ